MQKRGDSKFEDTSVWFTQILQQGKEQEVINQPNFLIWFYIFVGEMVFMVVLFVMN